LCFTSIAFIQYLESKAPQEWDSKLTVKHYAAQYYDYDWWWSSQQNDSSPFSSFNFQHRAQDEDSSIQPKIKLLKYLSLK